MTARKDLPGAFGSHNNAESTPQSRRPAAERFWGKVDKSGDCWMWTAYRNRDGYGVFGYDVDSKLLAHRASWLFEYGPIPDAMTVDHLCFQPGCVRPDHLRLLTLSENARNQRSALKSHCINGHEYTPENTYATPGGHRQCRECHRVRVRAYKAKKRADRALDMLGLLDGAE